MPVQQISVGPGRETASNGKSVPRSKDKNEGKKVPGRSASRSSNISKASNSPPALAETSRLSITPSSQDICSSGHPKHLHDDASEKRQQEKCCHTTEMTAISSKLGRSEQRKQLKRRQRRKKNSCTPVQCLDSSSKHERSDCSLSSDRSEKGEKREDVLTAQREAPSRVRTMAFEDSDSSSEDEDRREARSWSKEKARRAQRRWPTSRQVRESSKEGSKHTIELESIDSDEGKETQVVPRDGGGLKKRRSGTGSTNTEGKDSPRNMLSEHRAMEMSCRGQSVGGSSSLAEDGEDPLTKLHQEQGTGDGDVATPVPGNHCGVKVGMAPLCSYDSEQEVCRICHCEGDEEFPLIMPCRCTGSLSFVHQACLNQWIKSSDTRCCELCKFDFIMETKLKPLLKWERLHLTTNERRKIFCSVVFHLIAIVCMMWSIFILVKRTAEEIRLGKNEELRRISLVKYHDQNGILEWPFWTKLIVVAIGFTGGLIFMYIQSKVYLQLWRRLKAFNRIITVQNCPEKGPPVSQVQVASLPYGRRDTVEVPISSAPIAVQTDSDHSVEAAVAPTPHPV